MTTPISTTESTEVVRSALRNLGRVIGRIAAEQALRKQEEQAA